MYPRNQVRGFACVRQTANSPLLGTRHWSMLTTASNSLGCSRVALTLPAQCFRPEWDLPILMSYHILEVGSPQMGKVPVWFSPKSFLPQCVEFSEWLPSTAYLGENVGGGPLSRRADTKCI